MVGLGALSILFINDLLPSRMADTVSYSIESHHMILTVYISDPDAVGLCIESHHLITASLQSCLGYWLLGIQSL